jgi:hypothetical protein
VVAVMQRVAGVASVDVRKFDCVAENALPRKTKLGLRPVIEPECDEIVCLDPDVPQSLSLEVAEE